ncbi:MAG: LemA family protein [Alistipes sp.]|nr:LemA family protein [Alistipes sp.]
MKKSTIVLLSVVGVLLLLAGVCVSTYNGLVTKDETVSEKWGAVQTVYQRRADLIPNLVNTVKGYAAHESSTLQEVTEARAQATSIKLDPTTATPEQMQAWMDAQQELGKSLGRLLAIAESYPELKASQNFLALQSQLEGTENRISVERQRYNEAVKEYNVSVRRFPSNIIASMFGFDQKLMFEAQEGAEVAPVVQF